MSVLIKHADGEEYIISITTDLLSGLNEYLNQFYPDCSRVFLNEVPVSCKQYASEPTLIICESEDGIEVYKVVLKKIPGWIITSEKYRAEYLFKMRSVKIARDVFAQFISSSIGEKLVRDSVSLRDAFETSQKIALLNDELQYLRHRDKVLSERLELLLNLAPRELRAEYIAICRSLKTNEDSL
jgi:hypothetical protein